jgi:signal transduction histidine kinase
MSAARGSSFVRLPEFVRSTTFRWALGAAGAFGLCILLLFGFIYWQTAAYLKGKIEAAVTQAADLIAADAPERRLEAIDERLRQDLRRVQVAGLFGPDGHRIAGNLESMPAGLQRDRAMQNAAVVRVDNRGREHQTVRAVARSLPGGEVLVLGRNIDELAEVAEIVERTLVLGLFPALGLGVAAGVFLSLRAQKRVEAVHRQVQQIVAGDLRQRLPTDGANDPFNNLAVVVNGMLDEIETLIQTMAGIGDDIAHDLRTPLTRVRVRLERGRECARTLDELQAVVDQAVGGLDQSLAVMTALLRIAEIEHSRRLAAFGAVDLAAMVREVGDLYEPIAEDKRIALRVDAAGEATVHGDRDLLLEAVANLVDNAVKYTPEGGRVEVALVHRQQESLIRVADTGPGIDESEREAVFRRFYRSDKSRHSQGLGLGLNLVAAIVKMHGFRLTVLPGPGCVVEIACPQTAD